MKENAEEFLEPQRLRTIIKTYGGSYCPSVILKVAENEAEEGQEEETLNTASALWTRSKSEITEEQYKEFYHHVGHAFDAPWATLHSKVEGTLEYSLLLFIQSNNRFDLSALSVIGHKTLCETCLYHRRLRRTYPVIPAVL